MISFRNSIAPVTTFRPFMGAVCTACMTVLWAAQLSFAAQPDVSISIDKQSLLLGDSATLTVTVRNMDQPEAPELPVIPRFDVRYKGVRQESFSSFTMIVQGQKVRQEQSGGGYHFEYELVPQEAGLLEVPSLAIVLSGEVFRTNPFQMEVYDRAEKSEDIFVNVDIDRNDVYLGEKIVLTFSWYFNKNINNYNIRIPWLDGLTHFLVTDPELDESLPYQRFVVNGDKQVAAEKTTEFYRGQQYAVVRFQKILTPISTGTYTLDPVFLKCDVVQGYTRRGRHDFFDDFFDSSFDNFFGFGSMRQAVTEPFSTRSEPITITVHDIPHVDRPAQYSGAVGQFRFSVDAKPTQLSVGEPITLTMKVTGSGNLEQLELPPLPELPEFKSYEPESRSNVRQVGGEIAGEKIFEKVLVPRAEGEYMIPAVTFSYFDPVLRQYQTISEGPFRVLVAPSTVEEEVHVIAVTPEGETEVQKREIQILKHDIRYIKTALGDTVDRSGGPHRNLALWIIGFGLPPVILCMAYFYERHRSRLMTDEGFRRGKRALGQAARHLKDAERAVADSSPRSFYDALSRSICRYFADKLNRPVAGMTPDAVVAWSSAHLDPSTGRQLNEVMRRAELALFSSVITSPEERKNDLRVVKHVLAQMEKIIK